VIPLNLKLSGFLSYRDPVEVDFTGFDLACISGQNGAGKSSLLDAITWALFGQARKRDESVINMQSTTAEVSFTFAYESNQYRVIRSLARRKSTSVEFQILDKGEWRPLTEHTIRETQLRIESILRLDYETFINVSFFLQGHADQFAQQPPTRRKEILGNILGLEMWEVYKEHTTEIRREVESELSLAENHIAEIEAELAEEEPRKRRLAELDSQQAVLTASRKVQEAALASVKQLRLGLEKQRQMVHKLAETLERSQATLTGLETRLAGREAERQPAVEILKRASEVKKAYATWQEKRLELENWDKVASRFHEQEKRRLPFLEGINTEKAKLEQEQETLHEQESKNNHQLAVIIELKADQESAKKALAAAEIKLDERTTLENQTQAGRERQAGLRTENASLKVEMDELSERIKKLEVGRDDATCPLCGQPLSPEHRQSTLAQLQADGKQKGDSFRANKNALEGLNTEIAESESHLSKLLNADKEHLAVANTLAQLTERLEAMEKQAKEWKTGGAKRLAQVGKLLDNGKFAMEERKELAIVDKELARLGYNGVAHEEVRRIEAQSRTAEAEYRALESANSALKPLDDEIAHLNTEISTQRTAIENQQKEYEDDLALLAANEAQAPSFEAGEQSLYEIQERESQLNQEVGAARQKVSVLDDLRKRKKNLEEERSDLGLQIGRYKELERAFGKDGVPALLIEQALPEIEMKANEILGRLSDDSMHMHFKTQEQYKDEKRKDLRETLDIQVSDEAGEREYEMFSGGEAFRVNFAIRLALSEVLAQRKGARLQMLVIDEGFGSQDAMGRQRLIQSINAVRSDFAKILVITHLDELKDAFPTRIEVEKTERGSTVQVI
jgi:exonuclease SbcC